MQENDPVPAGHQVASPGAVIGVPACTARLLYRVITGPYISRGFGGRAPKLSPGSRSFRP